MNLNSTTTRGYYRPKRNKLVLLPRMAEPRLHTGLRTDPHLPSHSIWFPTCGPGPIVHSGFSAFFSPECLPSSLVTCLPVSSPCLPPLHLPCPPLQTSANSTPLPLSYFRLESPRTSYLFRHEHSSFKLIISQINTFCLRPVYSERDRNYNLRLLQFQ